MVLFTNKNDCCGCTACASICPQNAIEMKPDGEGFLYPEINGELCIECGACKRVCAFQNGYAENPVQQAYAVKHKNLEKRMKSRSGGVFAALSDYIIERGGSVYGAAFDEAFTVKHIRAEAKEETAKMQGSKYVQSDLNDCFKRVKEDLKQGKYVLFSGTGCQAAGLNRYLEGVDTERLLTCDLVCHGVPSPLIWKSYLAHCEKRFGGRVTGADFRDKTIGWSTHREAVWIDGKKHILNGYTYLFYENEVERPSCYVCKYSNTRRPADLTLADFWGIENAVKNFDDDKGVSLLLVNTEKGKRYFDKIKDRTDYNPCDTKQSFRLNPNLSRPTPKPDTREKFWAYLDKNGFEKTFKRYYARIHIKKRKRIWSSRLHKALRLAGIGK